MPRLATVCLMLALLAMSASASVLTARNGHYHARGAVNGHAVTFLIDTGATITALPADMATAARLTGPCHAIRSNTANGSVSGCEHTALIEFAEFRTIANVVVLPQLDAPLLGMNVLGKMRLEQRGNTLLLEAGDASVQVGANGPPPEVPWHLRLNWGEWSGLLLAAIFAITYLTSRLGSRRGEDSGPRP